MIKLSNRLNAVAEMVSRGYRAADVGTDHAYIPIYLVQTGRIEYAVAMDVNTGPLTRAKEHIRQAGLEAYIDTRLSDGLKTLRKGEADSLVIAGMGGALMIRILSNDIPLFHSMKEVILQPQSEAEEVRRFLIGQGFAIASENMVLEDGKFYVMMRCVPGVQPQMTDAAYRYGAYLLQAAHPVLKEFLAKEECELNAIAESLQQQRRTDAIARRITEVKQKMHIIHQAKKEITG